MLSSSLLGEPKPDEIYNLSNMFWVYPSVSYQLDTSKTPRRHPDLMPEPPQRAPFNVMQPLYSELAPDVEDNLLCHKVRVGWHSGS